MKEVFVMFAKAKFRSNRLKIALLCLCVAAVGLFGRDYDIDKGSKVSFEITKYAVLSVEGVFKEFSGHLGLDDSGKIVALHIQAVSDSISTGKAKRDKFAKERFLDAAKHPLVTLNFVSYTPKQAKKGDNSQKHQGTLVAKLTMQGKTRNIELQSSLDLSQATPKLTLKGKFNSKDFGVKGKMTSSNTVHLFLDTKWLEK